MAQIPAENLVQVFRGRVLVLDSLGTGAEAIGEVEPGVEGDRPLEVVEGVHRGGGGAGVSVH